MNKLKQTMLIANDIQERLRWRTFRSSGWL